MIIPNTVAPRIARIEASVLKHSDYFRMSTVIEDDEEGPEPEPTAVVLFAPGA